MWHAENLPLPVQPRCGWRQYDIQLAADYRPPANRYAQSTIADITTLHDLRCHPLNHFRDCRRLSAARCAFTPTIGQYPGCFVYGCQLSHSPGYNISPAFATGAKIYPPHARPSAYGAICWTAFPRDASYVGFVERVSRHMSCPSWTPLPASTFLFTFFILPVWQPPPPRCKVPSSYQAQPQLIFPWMTQHPRSGYIDVSGVPVDIAVECSSAGGGSLTLATTRPATRFQQPSGLTPTSAYVVRADPTSPQANKFHSEILTLHLRITTIHDKPSQFSLP